MMKTKRQDRLRSQHMRDTATTVAYSDPLSLPKLKELLALWQDRYKAHEYPDDTCRNMIKMYDLRIMRLEGAANGGT